MRHKDLKFSEELEKLLHASRSDFIAFAHISTGEIPIRWTSALGTRNERYKRMTVTKGVGLAGHVLRTGRWKGMTIPSQVSNREVADCPVMLAEQLTNAVALPIEMNPTIVGILYLGRRTSESYTDAEISRLIESLERGPFVPQENAMLNFE